MRSLLLLIVIFSALVVPAAAEEPRELTTRDGRPVHKVALLSRLGDKIVIYYSHPGIPLSVWEGEPRDYVLPEFAIDAHVEKTIASAISPRFEVVMLDPKVADTDIPTWNERTVQSKIAALPPRSDIDAYIVLCQDEETVEMGAFLKTHGLVLYHRPKLFGHVTALLGFYRIMIVDARTGETIGGREGGTDMSFLDSSIPRKEIDGSYWPGEDALPAPADVPKLRDKFYEFVDESLLWTLKRLNMTQ
jgi:hypothetical protein